MSFAAYNGVQQTTANSCGAFALAAALVHLGRIDATYILNTADLAQGFNQRRSALLAEFIYQSTGNLLLDHANGDATYQYLNPVSDMNAPSALACKATEFGVTHINSFYNNAAGLVFSAFQVTNAGAGVNLLDTEINLINPPRYGNVNGPVDYDELPAINEVHLLLVNNNDHWVVISNNQLYNPGDGFVGPYTANHPLPLTAISYNNGADQHLPFCGLWMSLIRQ